VFTIKNFILSSKIHARTKNQAFEQCKDSMKTTAAAPSRCVGGTFAGSSVSIVALAIERIRTSKLWN